MFERRKQKLLMPTSPVLEIVIEKYQANEDKLLQVKDMLARTNCKVQHLIIKQNQFTDKQINILVSAIRHAISLKSVQLQRCRIRNNQLVSICNAIVE